RVLCAARAANGGLTSSVFNGTSWSKFDNQAATAVSAPSCASDDAGRVVCAMIDTTAKVIVNRFNATAWEGFLNIAGTATGEPNCTDLGIANHVVCFARGLDMAYWGNHFLGGSWSTGQWQGWASLGGQVRSQGSCGVITTNQLICG